jgi:hypothetical protein
VRKTLRLVIAGVLLTGLLAACAGSIATSPAPQSPDAPVVAVASPAPSGDATCNTDTLPGWPAAGQISTSGIIPVLASSQKVVGKSRLVFSLIDQSNQPVASPDIHLQMAFYDLCASPTVPTETLTPTFAWGIVGQRGFYIVTPDLTEAGTWGVAVTATDASGKQATARLQFSVSATGTTPPIGALAPSVRTPILSDVGGDVRKISSDPNPDPALYVQSVDQALAAHEPFVLAFATPAFCTSAECGPTLDMVKATVKAYPILAINVEPYELTWTNGRLQPVLQNGAFVPVPATDAYGIPSEPWIFVIGASGRVVASYEAVAAPGELAAAITAAKAG